MVSTSTGLFFSLATITTYLELSRTICTRLVRNIACPHGLTTFLLKSMLLFMQYLDNFYLGVYHHAKLGEGDCLTRVSVGGVLRLRSGLPLRKRLIINIATHVSFMI